MLQKFTYIEWGMAALIGCILFGGIVLFIFIQTHQILAANFADDVLRPLLGTQNTLHLEATFFKAQDLFNQIKYSTIESPTTNVPQYALQPLPLINPDDNFLLYPIKPMNNLPQLPGEGVWTSINVGTSDAIMARTFLRPDVQRPYAVVTLVKMNMSRFSLGIVAGTWEPGENFRHGTGFIPKQIVDSNMLIAAFNGGFKRTDGKYGMMVGQDTYVPLQQGLATLLVYQDAKPQIVKYIGQNLGNKNKIVGIRQNGPLLVENGVNVSAAPAWNTQTWGLTTTNSMYTWRSGIGITKNGNLVYAVGPSLIPQTLAEALKAAGAVNAMQLDINPVWVRYVLFTSKGNGVYTYASLNNQMVNGGYEYLHGYQKDFFYLYKNGK